MSARAFDAPKPSFFRVCRYVICCNANATLFSTICDYYKVRARFHAFTFCFSEKEKRGDVKTAPLRESPDRRLVARAPPSRRTRRSGRRATLAPRFYSPSATASGPREGPETKQKV